jgi:hypothetical protein
MEPSSSLFHIYLVLPLNDILSQRGTREPKKASRPATRTRTLFTAQTLSEKGCILGLNSCKSEVSVLLTALYQNFSNRNTVKLLCDVHHLFVSLWLSHSFSFKCGKHRFYEEIYHIPGYSKNSKGRFVLSLGLLSLLGNSFMVLYIVHLK